ncbi:hypothetical protein COT72_03980 [archaeon CG10_big_fil_rev_8_21_14_0_10_43_11]|nr:MAG: hypothetical protein COT72_03980 [archaeon CG10_big_fil_rev_8_21_14_0_10_43_11]
MSFVLLVFSLPSLSFLVTDSFEFLRSLSDNLGIIQNRLASLFGHTALLIGLPLLIFLGKRKIPKQILLAILIFYYSVFAFILVYWAHGTRHLLFVLPIFSFLVVYSFKKVFTPRIFFLAVTLLFVVLISFSSLFFPVQSDEFLSDAASWIFQNTNSSDSILSNAYTALTVYANQEITSVPRRRIEFERLIENHSVDYLIVLHLYPLRHYERWPYLSDYIASESNDSHLDLVYTKSGKDPTTKVFSQIISVYKVE